MANDLKLIQSWRYSGKRTSHIRKLPGDASTRRYYRIKVGTQSLIFVKVEPFQKQGFHQPFIAVQRHLERSGVRVPKLIEADPVKGFMVLEDLGDTTLLHRLETVQDAESERSLYEKAIDALVEMQIQADPKNAKEPLESFKLAFDFKKLYWEVEFGIKHFYLLHLQRKFLPKDRKILIQGLTKICKELADQPRVFTHRDYHSRNLMLTKNEKIVMIDFQDARMGPAQYDLVSLLRDSYYQLAEAQVERLIDYYIARYQARSGERIHRLKFRKVFDLMTVQRNFKAIGSFASFQNLRGNPTYLKYVGNTFENIRRVLLRMPEYSKLREVMFHYYYF